MHTHRRLIVNTALMTGSSIVMRCIALIFQAWLVGHIGAAGIGLYQLVLSVSVLFATFAISGIRFAAPRLISEEMGSRICSTAPSSPRTEASTDENM